MKSDARGIVRTKGTHDYSTHSVEQHYRVGETPSR